MTTGLFVSLLFSSPLLPSSAAAAWLAGSIWLAADARDGVVDAIVGAGTVTDVTKSLAAGGQNR